MTVSGALLSNRAIAKSLLESLDAKRIAASDDPVEVGLAVSVGIRAAHLLGVEILQTVAEAFPASIQGLLFQPGANTDIDRDAFVADEEFIDFVDLIDILCEEKCECVAPQLHRGWQDKTQSCREARSIARKAVGYSIGERLRESLLEAVSIQNRLMRVPAPVQLSAGKARDTFANLLGLIERLAPPEMADEFRPLLKSLRS
ncbi:MAG: hypothetical protein GY854_24285 [Deltaproteobacteria bacterium]|nr:hypothetical protein [Deltaproteobacteria bacterium]